MAVCCKHGKSPEGPLNAFQSHRCLCYNYSARRDSQELITGMLLSWFLFKGTKVLVLWQFNMVSFRECPQNKAHFSHWLDMALTKVASVPKIYVETSLTKWITKGGGSTLFTRKVFFNTRYSSSDLLLTSISFKKSEF